MEPAPQTKGRPRPLSPKLLDQDTSIAHVLDHVPKHYGMLNAALYHAVANTHRQSAAPITSIIIMSSTESAETHDNADLLEWCSTTGGKMRKLLQQKIAEAMAIYTIMLRRENMLDVTVKYESDVYRVEPSATDMAKLRAMGAIHYEWTPYSKQERITSFSVIVGPDVLGEVYTNEHCEAHQISIETCTAPAPNGFSYAEWRHNSAMLPDDCFLWKQEGAEEAVGTPEDQGLFQKKRAEIEPTPLPDGGSHFEADTSGGIGKLHAAAKAKKRRGSAVAQSRDGEEDVAGQGEDFATILESMGLDREDFLNGIAIASSSESDEEDDEQDWVTMRSDEDEEEQSGSTEFSDIGSDSGASGLTLHF